MGNCTQMTANLCKIKMLIAFLYLLGAILIAPNQVFAAYNPNEITAMSTSNFWNAVFGSNLDGQETEKEYIICGNNTCDPTKQKCITSVDWSDPFFSNILWELTGYHIDVSIYYQCLDNDKSIPDGWEEAPEGGLVNRIKARTGGIFSDAKIETNACHPGSNGKTYCLVIGANSEEKSSTVIYSGNTAFRKCEVLPVKLYHNRRCFFCPLFTIVFATANDMTSLSFSIFAKAFAVVIAIGLAIWIAIKTLGQVASLTKQDAPKFLTDLIKQCYKFLIAFLLLQYSSQIYKWGIVPALNAGITFGHNIMGDQSFSVASSLGDAAQTANDNNPGITEQKQQINAKKGTTSYTGDLYKSLDNFVAKMQEASFMQRGGSIARSATSSLKPVITSSYNIMQGFAPSLGDAAQTANDNNPGITERKQQINAKKGITYYTGDLYESLDNLVAKIQKEFAFMQSVGSSLICIGTNAMLFRGQAIKFGGGFVLTIEGIVLAAYAFLLSIAFAFYLLDAVVQLGIAGALMPFLIASWPFKTTSKYAATGWKMILNSAFIFVFVGMVVLVNRSLISEAFEYIETDKQQTSQTKVETEKQQSSSTNQEQKTDSLQKDIRSGGLYKIAVAINSQNEEGLNNFTDISSIGFFTMILCCYFGFMFMKKTSELAGKFASGSSSNPIAPQIATMAGSAIKSGASKFTQHTRDAAKDKLSKGVKSVASAVAHPIRTAKAIKNFFKGDKNSSPSNSGTANTNSTSSTSQSNEGATQTQTTKPTATPSQKAKNSGKRKTQTSHANKPKRRSKQNRRNNKHRHRKNKNKHHR